MNRRRVPLWPAHPTPLRPCPACGHPQASAAAHVEERCPYELLLAGLCIPTGLALFLGPRPGSIEEAMSPGFATIWALSLFAGGALVILAAVMSDRFAGVLFEQRGLWVLCTGSLAYVLAAFAAVGVSALYVGAINAAFVGANVVQSRRITRYRRALGRVRPEGELPES